MKWLRFGPVGYETLGLLDGDGRLRDASSLQNHWSLADLPVVSAEDLPLADEHERIASPIPRPGKIIGIGLNYADHAEETGMPIPQEPIVFMKASSSMCGPNDNLRLPRDASKTDWEVELAVVIGKPASYVDEKDALKHVAGYMVANDVSERAFQAERGGQWTKGKSYDTFCPLGPWLVTADEVADPQSLRLWTKVNGETQQDGSTSTMIFGVAHVIAYLSRFMTLETGDVICTGTPPGVGMGQKPQRFLKAGDVVEIGIEGLGSQRQKVVQD